MQVERVAGGPPVVPAWAASTTSRRRKKSTMADRFDACLAFTLAQEGGYVDDLHDPGGATNMGVTLATYRHWDHDPALGPADVQAMTRQTAAAIYRALYWNALQSPSLPAGIDLSTFDFGVNAGTRRSAE